MLPETKSRAVLRRGAWTCVGRTTRSPSPLALPFTYSTVFHRLLSKDVLRLGNESVALDAVKLHQRQHRFFSELEMLLRALSLPRLCAESFIVLNSFCDIRTTLCQESLISRLATSCRVDGPRKFGRISGQPHIFLRALFEQV